MATSSFNRDVVINQDNYESLLEIIHDDNPKMASFEGVRKIELIPKEEINKWFK